MKAQRKNRVRAFTLIEMMLVVAIIALILVIVGRGFEVARVNQQVNNAISIVKTVRASSGIWETLDDYETPLSMSALDTYKLLPKNIVGSTGTAGKSTDPWGGDVTVAKAKAPNNVLITLTSVPDLACKILAQRLNNETIGTTCTKGILETTF